MEFGFEFSPVFEFDVVFGFELSWGLAIAWLWCLCTHGREKGEGGVISQLRPVYCDGIC